jgi:hypothetical protein
MSLNALKWGCGALFAALLVVAGPLPCVAQDANRAVVVSKADLKEVVERLSKRTDSFKEAFDREVEHTSLEGTKREDKAEDRVNDLHQSVKKLKDVYDDKKDKNNPEVRDHVDRTLSVASEVDRLMSAHRFTDKLQQSWDLTRTDLNALAAVYDLSPLR